MDAAATRHAAEHVGSGFPQDNHLRLRAWAPGGTSDRSTTCRRRARSVTCYPPCSTARLRAKPRKPSKARSHDRSDDDASRHGDADRLERVPPDLQYRVCGNVLRRVTCANDCAPRPADAFLQRFKRRPCARLAGALLDHTGSNRGCHDAPCRRHSNHCAGPFAAHPTKTRARSADYSPRTRDFRGSTASHAQVTRRISRAILTMSWPATCTTPVPAGGIPRRFG